MTLRADLSGSKVYLVEQNASGHRMHYIKLAAEAFLKVDAVPVIMVPARVAASPEFALHLGPMAEKLEIVHDSCTSLGCIVGRARSAGALRVLIPSGDNYLLEASLGKKMPSGISIAMIVMRVQGQPRNFPYAQRAVTAAKAVLIRLARARSKRIWTLASATEIRPSVNEISDPIEAIEPSAIEKQELRITFGLDPGLLWVGIIGSITSRKNVSLVVESLSSGGEHKVGLLIAGKVEGGYAAELQPVLSAARAEGLEIRLVDRLMSDKEIDGAIALVDAVILAHSNEGPSGIFGKALSLGTPILAAGAKSLAADIEYIPDSGRWVPLEAESLREGIGDVILLKKRTCSRGQKQLILNFNERLVSQSPQFGMYLAVLPFYRETCISLLKGALGNRVRIFAGHRQIDPTIRTGIDAKHYFPLKNRTIAGRVLLQTGHWRQAVGFDTLVLDLNPRSLSAWLLLVVRRALKRRTLLWGHLYPREGSGARTASLRKRMRSLAHGTILYGYDSVVPALQDLPRQPVWVAPNALYSRADMKFTASTEPRKRVLYVGRLVEAKKVETLLRGFALSGLSDEGHILTLVGSGSEAPRLESLAGTLGIEDSVEFLGQVTSPLDLRGVYSTAVCSVSPGYAGLSLTQSLGFGVPMVVARDELHAPEIELQRFGAVYWFESGSAHDLARAIRTVSTSATVARGSGLSDRVAAVYSAEAMASGLAAAVTDRRQILGPDGWPST